MKVRQGESILDGGQTWKGCEPCDNVRCSSTNGRMINGGKKWRSHKMGVSHRMDVRLRSSKGSKLDGGQICEGLWIRQGEEV